jgi:hypothetical protein
MHRKRGGRELTAAAIGTDLEHAARSPSELALMHLYPIDGAAHDAGPTGTPWGGRDATWSMVIAAIDPDPAKAKALTAWDRAYWEAVHKYNPGGAYPNFMSDDEGRARVRASCRANWERLAAVKRTYDRRNQFRVNRNIDPAG